MPTLEQIREDLKEIRLYYSKRAAFDNAIVEPTSLLRKVERYEMIVSKAPGMLNFLFNSLHAQNATQESVAKEMSYTPEYIQRLNKKLLLFLQSKLGENEGSGRVEIG